jgi:putative lipoic acid-binding regulatory protein
VVNINELDEKLELEYPCNWCYKVVGEEREKLETAIREVVLEREHSVSHSNTSRSGKYISLNLELLVHNEEDRQFIYEALKAHQNIRMVL